MAFARTVWSVPVLLVLLLLTPRHGFAAVACGSPDHTGASVCYVDPAIDPAALCNDGTVPAFWIRPGHDTGVDTWVIWLEGGGDCVDKLSCTKRANNKAGAKDLTSDGFSSAPGLGVLSAKSSINPVLYNANVVLAHYCSSDYWAGAYAAPGNFMRGDPTTWNFQGRRIAAAVVASVGELNPSLAAAHMILLGGSSAGGAGMTYNVNDILPSLPPSADIRLVNDAGFSLDIGQYDASAPAPYVHVGHPNAFDTSFEKGMTLWHGYGDSKCDAAAATQQAHVDCFNTSLLLQQGAIPLPIFVAESQIDLAQVADELCPQFYGLCEVPTGPATMQGQYATTFGATMAAALVGTGTPAAYTVSSPDIYVHVILADNAGFLAKGLLPGFASPRDAFNAWVSSPGTPRTVLLGTGPGVSPVKLP